MRSILGKLALAFAGLVVATLLVEAALRLASPQIFEVHPPGLYTQDPDVGYVLTPGFQGELVRPEFRTTVTTNSAGFRSPELRPRQPHTRRILLLGDSQTWGFGVNDDETYAVALEAMLSEQYPALDIQVINGGVPGYGTVDQLHLLQSRVDDIQPDLVVVQFLSVNDLIENRVPANTWATISDGMLAHQQNETQAGGQPAPLLTRIQSWLKQHSHLARLALDVGGYVSMRAGLLDNADVLWGEDFSQRDKELGVTYLSEIAETAEAHNALALFVYTTAQVHIVRDTYSQPASATVVEEAAAQSGVDWIDASAVLSQRSDKNSLYYAQNGHWTAAGHEAIAVLLAGVIVENELLEK